MKTTPAEIIHGIWPPMMLETTQNGCIDYDALDMVARYFADVGVHGLYTGDTASEFYTMEYAEWDELAVAAREIIRDVGLPAGIGCTWTNQTGALRRIARARELRYDNIHLSPPYWIKLNATSLESYWRAVAEVAGDLPIFVYAGSQGQFPLDGALVKKLREWCPAIAGVKAPGFDPVTTNSMLIHGPELAHFVHEQVLCASIALGASGCFSALVGLCPKLVMEWYGMIERREWEEAFAIQRRVNRFYDEGVQPVRRAGFVVDKALSELGGVPRVTRNLRAPYAPLPDDLFEVVRTAADRHLPEYRQH